MRKGVVMGKVSTNQKEIDRLKFGKSILWDAAVLYIISLITILMPFAHYRYKKTQYALRGLEFFKGVSIQGGSVTIEPQGLVIAVFILSLTGLFLTLIFPKIKVRISATLLCVVSFVQLVLLALFTSGVSTVLEDTKKPGISYGVIVMALLSVLVIIRCLWILYLNKVLSVLDFMILLGALYLFINNYCPMAGLYLAFKQIDYSIGFIKSPWVGFQNFAYLFSTSDAWVMTRNTILYNVAFIILGNLMGILTGLFLSELLSSKLQKFFQTAILMPQLISIIIVAYIVFAFLSNEAGMVTKLLEKSGTSINFYNSPQYWPFIIIFVNVWKGLGYAAVMYLAAILGIDRSLYEAAYVDGATKVQRIFRITLPLLKPTIITLFTMQVGRIFFSDFGLFFQVPMNSGALYSTTQTIDTFVYRALLQQNSLSMSSAAGLYQSVVGFVVVLLANYIIRRMDKENAMF